MKKLLTLLLALNLLGGVTPVIAADTAEVSASSNGIPAWAYSEMADGYAMGLFGDEIYTAGRDNTVAEHQLVQITETVANKLALLNVPANPNKGEALVIDTTRGGVLNALYQEAAAYRFDGIDTGAVEFLSSLGVVKGDNTGLALDRPCTMLEAVVFANRLILALYDQQNAGSIGLLWKAEGNGNTLYLLGSIHTDRNNLYPFHKQLRDIITGAELAAFELDFNDQDGLAEFTTMQVYSDGTTLKDHISSELYQKVVDALVPMGIPEEQTAMFKPWALANSFTALAAMDETTSDNAMAIDLYVNSKASNAGIPVAGIETYAFQGSIFEDLSAEYQENYLALTLALFQGVDIEGLEEETQTTAQNQNATMDEWMEQWKARDTEGFANSYPKDELMAEDSDEFNHKLFEGRDPNLTAWADSWLKQEGSHTGLMTVGAGHMIGKTGVVQGLKDLGYTVEVVSVP